MMLLKWLAHLRLQTSGHAYFTYDKTKCHTVLTRACEQISFTLMTKFRATVAVLHEA